LTGKRPPSRACGDGSIPHSYASCLARLYRAGPVTEAMPTEKAAKPNPMAKRMMIGRYGLALTGRKSRCNFE